MRQSLAPSEEGQKECYRPVFLEHICIFHRTFVGLKIAMHAVIIHGEYWNLCLPQHDGQGPSHLLSVLFSYCSKPPCSPQIEKGGLQLLVL